MCDGVLARRCGLMSLMGVFTAVFEADANAELGLGKAEEKNGVFVRERLRVPRGEDGGEMGSEVAGFNGDEVTPI